MKRRILVEPSYRRYLPLFIPFVTVLPSAIANWILQEKKTLIIFKISYLLTCLVSAVSTFVLYLRLFSVLRRLADFKTKRLTKFLILSCLLLINSIILILFMALDATTDKWKFLILTMLQRIEEDLFALQCVQQFFSEKLVQDMNRDEEESKHMKKVYDLTTQPSKKRNPTK